MQPESIKIGQRVFSVDTSRNTIFESNVTKITITEKGYEFDVDNGLSAYDNYNRTFKAEEMFKTEELAREFLTSIHFEGYEEAVSKIKVVSIKSKEK